MLSIYLYSYNYFNQLICRLSPNLSRQSSTGTASMKNLFISGYDEKEKYIDFLAEFT